MTRECVRTWRSVLAAVLSASCLGACDGSGGLGAILSLSTNQVAECLDNTAPYPQTMGTITFTNNSEEHEVTVSFGGFASGFALERPAELTMGPGTTEPVTIRAAGFFTGEQLLPYTITSSTDPGLAGEGVIFATNTCGSGNVYVYFDTADLSQGVGGRDLRRVLLDGTSDNTVLPGTESSANVIDYFGVGVSPGGTTILFSKEYQNNPGVVQLWGANSDGTNEHLEQNGGTENQFPDVESGSYVWSQDGDIWHSGAAGLFQVTGGPENDYDPSLGEVGGQTVIFFSRHDPFNVSSDIYRISPSGTGLTPVAAGALSEDHPSYSFANGKIVFEEAAQDLSEDDLWVMDPDGSNRVRVTDDDFDDDDPVWSPDGMWIVWERSNGLLDQVVKIAWPLQPGAQPIPLTDLALDARRPAIQPR